MTKILFIITGGTIDSLAEGYRDKSIITEERKSFLPDYIESLKLYTTCEFVVSCLKDSNDINDEDRQNICEIIDKSEYDKIIITHGTDTMANTACYLDNHVTRKDISIFITGAMHPLEGRFSDGGFNLGFAFSSIESAKEGVFIAMHGRLFVVGEVRKDFDNYRFVDIPVMPSNDSI